jgi:hypothetical protein
MNVKGQTQKIFGIWNSDFIWHLALTLVIGF